MTLLHAFGTIGIERNNMETNTNQTPPVSPMNQEQMLEEILKYTKQTRNYIRWQMYITIVLVVLPILASLFIIPFVLQSLSSSYGSLLQ
jgi:hypothetical protein